MTIMIHNNDPEGTYILANSCLTGLKDSSTRKKESIPGTINLANLTRASEVTDLRREPPTVTFLSQYSLNYTLNTYFYALR